MVDILFWGCITTTCWSIRNHLWSCEQERVWLITYNIIKFCI